VVLKVDSKPGGISFPKGMRKLAFLLFCLLAVAGGGRTFAQIYSVNAVGYVSVTLAPGEFKIICNPLNVVTNGVQNNVLDAILPNAPNGTRLFRFGAGSQSFTIFTRRSMGWTPFGGTTVINPGEGFFIQNVSQTNITLTFVGEVPQGVNLTIQLVAGFNLVAPHVPVSGLLETEMKLPAAQGDRVYLYRDGVYHVYRRLSNFWLPAEPVIGVGEGFYFHSLSAKPWIVTFLTSI